MRTYSWSIALVLALGVSLPLRAQVTASGTATSGNGPSTSFMPVNFMSGFTGIQGLTRGVRHFFDFQPNLQPLVTGTHQLNVPNLPTTQPGMSYLQQFGYRVPQPAQ